MAQITISKPVGQGAIGALPADIKTIQILLADKKDKSFKKLYQGKIDGKIGPKTITGICALQALNNINETAGLVRPVSTTMNKLRFGASSGAIKDIEVLSALEQTSTGNGLVKTRQVAKGTCNVICNAAPIPRAEAGSLSKIVSAAGDQGIPLYLEAVSVTITGRIRVSLAETVPVGLSMEMTPNARQIRQKTVHALVAKSTNWSAGSSTNLAFETSRAFKSLQGGHKPSNEFLKASGIGTMPSNDVLVRCCAALERAQNGVDEKATTEEAITLIKDIGSKSTKPQDQKIVKFVEDRDPFEVRFDIVDGKVWTILENAINEILPVTARAIEAIVNRTDLAVEEMEFYFKSSTRKTAQHIVAQLENARKFLSAPRKSLFIEATIAQADPLLRPLVERVSSQTLAFEANGRIVFFKDRINRNYASLGEVLLHESLHRTIDEKFQRGASRNLDPAYENERDGMGNLLIETLETKVALTNPDSYVILVRNLR